MSHRAVSSSQMETAIALEITDTSNDPSSSGTSQRPVQRAAVVRPHGNWPPAQGTILLGKYEVERTLGRGGMGVVVVAKHMQLGSPVAVKFLHPSAMEDRDIMMRFVREARAIASIRSDHVVKVLDVGTLETGEPFMMMEMLEGIDLSRAIKGRALPLPEAIGFALQTCAALREVHAAGIVHRDLKPSNLFLAKRLDGSQIIKLIDFGISKMAAGEDAEGDLTRTSTVLGSPRYMAPEQLRSARNVDARADIWSLGVILFRLLAGTPPFNGGSDAELSALVLMADPPSLSAIRPDLPPIVEQIVMRCMQKDPAARFQTVDELVMALESLRVASSDVIPRLPSSPALPPALASAPSFVPTAPQTMPRGSLSSASYPVVGAPMVAQPSSPSWVALAVVAGVAAAMAVLASAMWFHHRAHTGDGEGAKFPAAPALPTASASPPTLSVAAPASDPPAQASVVASARAPSTTPKTPEATREQRRFPVPVPAPARRDNPEFGDRK